MLPVIPKPGISSRRKAVAVMVAGAADLLQIGLFPAFGVGYLLDDVIDVFTAVALTAICGFKWQFALAFGMELVPFLDILPTWTAVALLLSVRDEGMSGQRVNVTVAGQPAAKLMEVESMVVPPVQAPPVQGVHGVRG